MNTKGPLMIIIFLQIGNIVFLPVLLFKCLVHWNKKFLLSSVGIKIPTGRERTRNKWKREKKNVERKGMVSVRWLFCYITIWISSIWYQELKSKPHTLRKYPVFYPDSFLCFFWNHNIIIFLPCFSSWNPSYITFYPFYLINYHFSINCQCLYITKSTFACYCIYTHTYIYKH